MNRVLLFLVLLFLSFQVMADEQELKDPTLIDPRLKKSWRQTDARQGSEENQEQKPVLKGRIFSNNDALVLIEFSGKVFMLREKEFLTTVRWGKINIKKITSTQVILELPSVKQEWILK